MLARLLGKVSCQESDVVGCHSRRAFVGFQASDNPNDVVADDGRLHDRMRVAAASIVDADARRGAVDTQRLSISRGVRRRAALKAMGLADIDGSRRSGVRVARIGNIVAVSRNFSRD